MATNPFDFCRDSGPAPLPARRAIGAVSVVREPEAAPAPAPAAAAAAAAAAPAEKPKPSVMDAVVKKKDAQKESVAKASAAAVDAGKPQDKKKKSVSIFDKLRDSYNKKDRENAARSMQDEPVQSDDESEAMAQRIQELKRKKQLLEVEAELAALEGKTKQQGKTAAY